MVWFFDIVLQAWKQLRAYALRSALTAVGIVIAVTGVITITGVMQGLNAGVNRELSKLGSDNIMITPNYNKMGSGQKYTALGRREWDALRHHVKGVSLVVASSAIHHGKVRYRDRQETLKVMAVSDQLPRLYGQYPVQGRFLSESDESAHRRVCVISSHLIERFGLPNDPIGERLQIGRLSLQIVGVMPGDGDTGGALKQLGALYLPLSVAEELSERQLWLDFGFSLTDEARNDIVLPQVRQILRQSQSTPPQEDDNFKIEDAASVRKINDTIIGLISLVLMIVVSISLIVGGIGIMNVMLVSVNERTREIGILRALGATKQHIRVQFLVEAAILSGVGAMVGVALGWIIAEVISMFIPGSEGAHLPFWSICASVGVAVLVGLLSGALPAARAAELDPVVALSKE
jgi:putative ABC transport system permease protein